MDAMRFENLINPTGCRHTGRVMGRWAAMIINQIGNDLARGVLGLVRTAKENSLVSQARAVFICLICNMKKHKVMFQNARVHSQLFWCSYFM